MIQNLQLVFDCSDPDKIMRFWGRALGYNNEFAAMTPDQLTEWRKGFPQFDGRGRVDDTDGRRMPIYIQKVPEPKTGRNRLRPEIAVHDVASFADDVRALGGAARDGACVDVEGNEFTVIEADGATRLATIVIDALDPERQLAFWTLATGYVASGDRCDPPAGAKYVLPFSDGTPTELDLAPGLRFAGTDEPKRVKNRLHLDIHVPGSPEATRDTLTREGATVLQWDSEQVMADPEGNEFCVSGVST